MGRNKTSRSRAPVENGAGADEEVVTFASIVESLHDEDPPTYDEQVLKEYCQSVLRDADRLFDVRALLSAFVSNDESDTAGGRIPSTQFLMLGPCKGWLPYAKMPTDQTVRNFIDGIKPRSPETLAAYLYALSVLKRFRHPRFAQLTVQALVRKNEPLAMLEYLLDLTNGEQMKLRAYDVARMGQQFYHVISRGNDGLQPSAFDQLLASPLFANMDPVTDDQQLEEQQRHITAIRLGSSGRTYVVSQLSFALVVVGQARDRYLYVRTRMASPGTDPVTRSHGFVIPAAKHTYLAQYHLDGQGFNIGAISNSDLQDAHCRHFRSMILAVDREGDAGALSSKLVLIQAHEPEKLVGNFEREELEHLLGEDGCQVSFANIVEYLHNVGEVSIRSLGDSAEPNRYTLLATWPDLLAYVGQAGVKDRIKGLRPEELGMLGAITRPLRTE